MMDVTCIRRIWPTGWSVVARRFGSTISVKPSTTRPTAETLPAGGVYRLVQRLDGFVSLDSPYNHQPVTVVTRPLIFAGRRLLLNIDTDATGYAQVGILDEQGNRLPGFSEDKCVYINGDFVEEVVEWLDKGTDVSELAGQKIRLAFRMRGSKLYRDAISRIESR